MELICIIIGLDLDHGITMGESRECAASVIVFNEETEGSYKMSLNRYKMTGLASLVLAISVLLMPGVAFGQAYEGAEFCKDCHEANYNDWKASGHPYKLMKGEFAKHRPIPLPGGRDWPEGGDTPLATDDVSYVIGGYKWKSRYIDKDGYIITVTEDEDGIPQDGVNQYNYLTGTWSSYHAGEEKKPYDCGVCHTTNWVANPDPTDLSGNQDGLPGMWGKFDDGGIHCEQCHGNGFTMNVDKSAEACGACHYRTSPPGSEVNSIPASGGFIKHHEQYNEFLASPHSSMNCVTCHDPHKRGEYSIKEGMDCSTVCHKAIATSYAENSMADYNVECKDCHMPYATKSAAALGPHQGDLQTHIFYINTDADGELFTAAGDFVALDGDGKAAVTMDFACQRCHETAELTELSRFAKNFHGTERDEADALLPELFYAGLNPGLTGNWWGGASRDGEGFLLDLSYSNGVLVMIVSFYTYDNVGNQVWLIGAGLANNGMTATVDLTIPEGAKWGPDFDPADLPTPRTPWGQAEFTFPTCGMGTVLLMPNADMQARGFVDYGYDVNRDVTIPGIACPIMMNNAN